MAAETAPACVDCDRPATKSYGTLWLCQYCWWAELSAILERRPDLRAPQTGIGVPVDSGLGLRCDICNAGWSGPAGETCWWCVERRHYQTEEQSRMDRSRYIELINRIRQGDLNAIHPAARILEVAVPAGRLEARWAAHMMAGAIQHAA